MRNFKHFKQHLENEDIKGTREYYLKRCLSFLALIAKIKDRKESLVHICNRLGYSETDLKKIETYSRAIVWLENAFNRNLKKVEIFNHSS